MALQVLDGIVSDLFIKEEVRGRSKLNVARFNIDGKNAMYIYLPRDRGNKYDDLIESGNKVRVCGDHKDLGKTIFIYAIRNYSKDITLGNDWRWIRTSLIFAVIIFTLIFGPRIFILWRESITQQGNSFYYMKVIALTIFLSSLIPIYLLYQIKKRIASILKVDQK